MVTEFTDGRRSATAQAGTVLPPGAGPQDWLGAAKGDQMTVLEVPDSFTPRQGPGLQVSMGPQHPSTHGVLRLRVRIDGERILECDPDIGYLHRCFEKIAENQPYASVIPYTDRTDYIAAMTNELAYVLAVEELLEIEVPPRAQAIRVMVSEMMRIASHLLWFGTFVMDLGATTAFLWAWRDRERLLDLFEMLSGVRMMFHYVRVGGVRNDLPSNFVAQTREFFKDWEDRLAEYHALVTGNPIFQARTKGIAVLSREDAIAYGASGPVLRASGVRYDVRKMHPYSGYDRYDFEIPVGATGDIWDRYLVRMEEMRQSARIVAQVVDSLPEGDWMGKVPRRLKPARGDAYSRIESPRGEIGVYLVSDGKGERPYRLHWRAPSFVHLELMPKIAPGLLIADVVAIIGSIDIVLGEVDR